MELNNHNVDFVTNDLIMYWSSHKWFSIEFDHSHYMYRLLYSLVLSATNVAISISLQKLFFEKSQPRGNICLLENQRHTVGKILEKNYCIHIDDIEVSNILILNNFKG